MDTQWRVSGRCDDVDVLVFEDLVEDPFRSRADTLSQGRNVLLFVVIPKCLDEVILFGEGWKKMGQTHANLKLAWA